MVAHLAQLGDPIHYSDPRSREEGSGTDQGAWGVLEPAAMALADVGIEVGTPIDELLVQVERKARPAFVGVGEAKSHSFEAGEHTQTEAWADHNVLDHLGYGEGGTAWVRGDIVGLDVGGEEGNGKIVAPEGCTSFRASELAIGSWIANHSDDAHRARVIVTGVGILSRDYSSRYGGA